MNGQQLLRNADIEPTSEVIAEALGSSNTAYIKFIEGLKSHDIQMEWRYYNDGKAWLAKGLYKWAGVRGGQNEITAFWLSIWDGFFKTTFFIPEKVRLEALNLPVDGNIKEMIADSKQMGKLKFFPLVFDLRSDGMRSDELFDDVYTLIDFRKIIK